MSTNFPPSQPTAEFLREEFNRWAAEGRGESMEDHHLPIVLPVLPHLHFQSGDRVLDVGCGSGWLCRLIARGAPGVTAMGIDVSDEMIARAREASASLPQISFEVGTAEKIPAPDAAFTKVISVESAYYWPDPAAGIQAISRVLSPGGSACIIINYYRDNEHCHQWGTELAIPTKLMSAADWVELFRSAGLTDVDHWRVPDPTPSPEVYTGRWFRDAEQMRKFKQEGALVVRGFKPNH
jgi:arsenite methyltransferase